MTARQWPEDLRNAFRGYESRLNESAVGKKKKHKSKGNKSDHKKTNAGQNTPTLTKCWELGIRRTKMDVLTYMANWVDHNHACPLCQENKNANKDVRCFYIHAIDNDANNMDASN